MEACVLGGQLQEALGWKKKRENSRVDLTLVEQNFVSSKKTVLFNRIRGLHHTALVPFEILTAFIKDITYCCSKPSALWIYFSFCRLIMMCVASGDKWRCF